MDIKTGLKFNSYKKFLFPIMLIFGAHLPLIFLGGDSFIITDDNLNGEFLYSHLLKISENIFNINQNAILNNIGGGVALKYFHSPFSPFRLLFLFFDSFDAYLINSFIVRIVAFFGMYFLIRDHFKKNELLTILISLSFAFVPAYSSFGLTVFGQPLLLWSFLNLEKSIKEKLSIGVIIIFSFYSFFALVTPFIIFWISIYILYRWAENKKLNKNLLLGLLLFFTASILANIHIISTLFLTGEEQTFRFSRQIINLPSFKGVIYNFFKTISFGDTTVNLFISIPILFLIIVTFLNKKANKKILLLLLIVFFNALIHSLYPIISLYLGKHFSILSAFGIGRFIFLNTFILYLIFIHLLNVFNNKTIFYSIILIISLNFLRSMDFYYNSFAKFLPEKYIHLVYEEDKFIKSLLPQGSFNNPPHQYHESGFYSFNEYYSQELFKEIDEFIGIPKDEYKIVNLGIHPSISQYNGFYTLDGYIVNYPIKLYKRFKKINKKELDKIGVNYSNITIDNTLRIISSDLENLCGVYCFKKFNVEPIEIDLDFKELKSLNVQYLLSTAEIKNQKKLRIIFKKKFENSKSPYLIYLYKII